MMNLKDHRMMARLADEAVRLREKVDLETRNAIFMTHQCSVLCRALTEERARAARWKAIAKHWRGSCYAMANENAEAAMWVGALTEEGKPEFIRHEVAAAVGRE